MKVRLLQVAKVELDETVNYYNHERSGLGYVGGLSVRRSPEYCMETDGKETFGSEFILDLKTLEQVPTTNERKDGGQRTDGR